jgi:hypothetical protein
MKAQSSKFQAQSSKLQAQSSKLQAQSSKRKAPRGASRFWLAAGLLLLIGGANAFAAKYAGEFLEIGVGARGVGMGGAMSSVTNEGSAFYWNPAGMGYVGGLQFNAMYADLWDGLANYSVAGLTLPISAAVFSANWVRLSVPDIQRHADYDQFLQRPDSLRFVIRNGDTIRYNSVQEYLLATGARPQEIFADNESAIFLTFAKLNKFTLDLGWSYFQIPIELPVGASVKVINQSLAGTTGSGVGVDLGMQIRFSTTDIFHEKWKAKLAYGFNWQDLTRTQIDWGDNNKDAMPSNFRNGISLTQKMPGKNNYVALALDHENRFERTWHYGLEYRMDDVLALRGGYWGDDWTAGAGISVWRATVDYAYRGRDLGTTHRVSVGVKLK